MSFSRAASANACAWFPVERKRRLIRKEIKIQHYQRPVYCVLYTCAEPDHPLRFAIVLQPARLLLQALNSVESPAGLERSDTLQILAFEPKSDDRVRRLAPVGEVQLARCGSYPR